MKVRLVCCLSSLKSVLRPTGDRLRETFSIYTWLSSFERWLIEANPVLDKQQDLPFFKEKEKDLGQRVTSESLPVWVLEQHKLPLRPDFFIYVISWNRLWLNPSGSAGVLLYGGKRKAYWLWNLKVEIRTWLAPWVGWSLPGSPAFLPFQSPTSFSTPLSFASDPTSSHFAFPPMQKMESLRPE